MKCPNCHQILTENSPDCPSCQFSLSKLDAYLGITAPALTEHATDLTQSISPAEIRRLNNRLSRYQKRFPQCRFAVIFDKTPNTLTPEVYTFWLFNRAGLTHIMKKEGECFLVLLFIDPARMQASAMIGYGLEPLIPQETLQNWIQQTESALKSKQFIPAAFHFFAKATDDLQKLPAKLQQAFGWLEDANNRSEISPY